MFDKMNSNNVVVTILIFLLFLSPTRLFVYAQREGDFNDRGIATDTIKWLTDGLKYVRINIDINGFIGRLKSDFKPKEWLSSAGGEISGVSGENLGLKIGQLWDRINGWLQDKIGFSIEDVGSFLAGVFVAIFKFLVEVLKKTIGGGA